MPTLAALVISSCLPAHVTTRFLCHMEEIVCACQMMIPWWKCTHIYSFPPQLPLSSQKCDVLPVLQQPLLSLGQFYDAGLTATLHIETVQLTKDVGTTLSGTRYHNNGLYFIPLQGYLKSTPPPPLTAPEMSTLTSAYHIPPQAYVSNSSLS